jgi:hypothetical protein
MLDGTDMSTPVTRGELEQRLALLATKTDLEIWGGALLARIESGEQRLIARMEAMDQRLSARMDTMTESMHAMEQRLLDELGRHSRAAQEAAQRQIAALDDKYGDLPGRMKRVETKVFPRRRR